ncbi:MAG: hypothetical protein Q7S76_00525 [bacterium]|nr:hypothetical protein [bacterium]
MPKEIANKTKEETYYKCTHCGDEIFWNTHKKFTYCKCKKIWVDGCATLFSYERSELENKKYPCGKDYVRVGGNEEDRKVIKK